MIGGAPNKRHCLRAKRWLFEPKKPPLRKTMPRANRHFLPGHVWHIAHQCSSQFQSFQPFHRFAPFQSFSRNQETKFVLSGSLVTRNRRRYLHWVFEAKKRFGLSVVNYVVTSNHIHLLLKTPARKKRKGVRNVFRW